jgi:hypothetical protein
MIAHIRDIAIITYMAGRLRCHRGAGDEGRVGPERQATLARSAHTVAALGDSLAPGPPMDEAYFARVLE